MDAVLLADFLTRRNEPIAELGLGSGAASLAALYLEKAASAWGIEIQEGLAKLADLNATRGGFPLEVHRGDLRRRTDLGPAGRFTRVIANPPFRGPTDGRRSPDPDRDTARRETSSTLTDFLDAARWLLANGGRLTLVYSARRLAELIAELRKRRLEPKRLRLVHPSPNGPARLVLIESVRDGGIELNIHPPLFTHEAAGDYSEEMERILAGRISSD